MTRFTVLGASGFIGSHLVNRLREAQIECFAPGRDQVLTGRQLGTVIYSIGLTSDFRSRPFETLEAHVCKLRMVLESCEFDKLVYLSSTRLYRNTPDTREEADLFANPTRADDLYNLSKLTGECLALNSGRPARVARLSNVYGADFHSQNFISSVLRDAVQKGMVRLQSSLDSEKDYVSIDDAVDVLIRIATSGTEQIYNVASGINVTVQDLKERLQQLIACEIQVDPEARQTVFTKINIERVQREFDFQPAGLLDNLARLVEIFKAGLTKQPTAK